MNKNFYQVLAIILIAYIAFVAIYISWGLLVINNRNATQQWFLYTHNNTVYKLKIADDESEWQKGLSGLKTKPANYDGMIFIFPDKRIRSFWNQNTYLTLDILWLDNFKRTEGCYGYTVNEMSQTCTRASKEDFSPTTHRMSPCLNG